MEGGDSNAVHGDRSGGGGGGDGAVATLMPPTESSFE